MPLFLQALLAATPILLAAILLVGFRLPAKWAMPVVYIVAFLIAGLTALPQQDWWRSSQIAPHIQPLAMKVADYLPRDVARHIRYS